MGRVSAALYDLALRAPEEAGLRTKRRELLAGARGEVLEIGAGTGLNFALYPAAVQRVRALEPDPGMARRARDKAAAGSTPIEVLGGSAQALPFPDDSFDTVVGTLVLCTVPDPAGVLAEVARVLRPGGRYLFLEHVRDGDERVARWQDRVTPLWRHLADGCHPNRATLETLAQSRLRVEEVRRGHFPKAAWIVRPLILGAARAE